MKPSHHLLRFALSLVLFLPWSAPISFSQTGSPYFATDSYGDSAARLVALKQGWSTKEREWFYSTSQGSQLMPYAYYLALEQAGNNRPFNDPANLQKFRCIPRSRDASNPDGLPVGFVADPDSPLPKGFIKDRRSLGFTCAACHTGQINYKGTAIRIDGGPSLADFDSLTKALEASLKATFNQNAKFDRFARKVLVGENNDAGHRAMLRAYLAEAIKEGGDYIWLNHSDLDYGFGRLDAFGRIFNRALVIIESHRHIMPNAPVSFPFLWDTPRADRVQWTGSAVNGFLGSLGRNVGEAVGVFAAVDMTAKRPPVAYTSSASFHNLRSLEHRLRALKSPQWPAEILPAIDSRKAAAGQVLFQDHCVQCHPRVNTFPLARSYTAARTPIADTNDREGVQTDATAAALIRDSRDAPTGILKGAKKGILLGKETYGDTADVFPITQDTVGRLLVGSLFGPKLDQSRRVKLAGNVEHHKSSKLLKMTPPSDYLKDLRYSGRSLDGIWATAPYLHNGSVPTLYDLLLPEAQRPKTFSVGRREFDPIKVGYVTSPAPGTFLFNTKLKGNSNKGHDYGTSRMSEEQRMQLVEYLKTL